MPHDVDSGSEAENGDELYIDNNEVEEGEEGEGDEDYDEGIPRTGKSASRQNNAKEGTEHPAPRLRKPSAKPRNPRTPKRPRKKPTLIDTPPRSSTKSGGIGCDSTSPSALIKLTRSQPARDVQLADAPGVYTTPTAVATAAAAADPSTDRTGAPETREASEKFAEQLLSPAPSSSQPNAGQPNTSAASST